MSSSSGDQAPSTGGTPAGDGPIGRRRFLELATACAGACTGVAALGTVAVVVVAPTLGGTPSSDAWLDVGALAGFQEASPFKVSIEGERVDAWQRRKRVTLGSVVVTRRGEQVEALSAVCPHNGCDVVTTQDGISCPCHDSRFGPRGEVLSGPSPRGLDPLEVDVAAGRVRVRLRRFAVGTAERRPL